MHQVENLTKDQKAPLVQNNYTMFELMPGVFILDEDETHIDISDDINDEIILNNVEELIGAHEIEFIPDEQEQIAENEENIENLNYISEDDAGDVNEHSDGEHENNLDAIKEQEIASLVNDANTELAATVEEDIEVNDITLTTLNNNDNITVDDVTTSDSNNEGASDHTSSRPYRAAAGAGIDRLEMNFGGKSYYTVKNHQMLIKKNRNYTTKEEEFHRSAVDMMFT